MARQFSPFTCSTPADTNNRRLFDEAEETLMPIQLFSPRAVALAFVLTALTVTAFAQQSTDAQRLAEAKVWVSDYLRYYKYESKFSAQETDRLAELRVKVHSPATTLEDRQAALKEFATLIFRAAGTNPPP